MSHTCKKDVTKKRRLSDSYSSEVEPITDIEGQKVDYKNNPNIAMGTRINRKYLY